MADYNSYTDAVKAAISGDRDAYTWLYQRTSTEKYKVAMKYTNDQQTASKVLQDAYADAWKKLDTLEDPESFPAWIELIVIREAQAAVGSSVVNSSMSGAGIDLSKQIEATAIDQTYAGAGYTGQNYAGQGYAGAGYAGQGYAGQAAPVYQAQPAATAGQKQKFMSTALGKFVLIMCIMVAVAGLIVGIILIVNAANRKDDAETMMRVASDIESTFKELEKEYKDLNKTDYNYMDKDQAISELEERFGVLIDRIKDVETYGEDSDKLIDLVVRGMEAYKMYYIELDTWMYDNGLAGNGDSSDQTLERYNEFMEISSELNKKYLKSIGEEFKEFEEYVKKKYGIELDDIMNNWSNFETEYDNY